MIKDADKSGSGKIGFNEFYSMMTSKMAEIDRPSDLRTAFECYDTAGKGFISAEQFRAIMAEKHGYSFTDKEVCPIGPLTRFHHVMLTDRAPRFAISSRLVRWRVATSTTTSSFSRWVSSKHN